MDEEAIARLVEEKVQQALAGRDLKEERERLVWLLRARGQQLAEGQRREEARFRAQQTAAEAATNAVARQLKLARSRRLHLESTPVGFWLLDGTLKWRLLTIALPFGLALTLALEPLIGHSLVAGYAVCPVACHDCTGPGRIAMWTTNSEQEVGQLCDSPKLHLHHKVTFVDVEEPKNEPYRVSMRWNAIFNVLGLGLVVLFGWPFYRSAQERRRRRVELASLIARIAELEAKQSHYPAQDGAYR